MSDVENALKKFLGEGEKKKKPETPAGALGPGTKELVPGNTDTALGLRNPGGESRIVPYTEDKELGAKLAPYLGSQEATQQVVYDRHAVQPGPVDTQQIEHGTITHGQTFAPAQAPSGIGSNYVEGAYVGLTPDQEEELKRRKRRGGIAPTGPTARGGT